MFSIDWNSRGSLSCRQQTGREPVLAKVGKNSRIEIRPGGGDCGHGRTRCLRVSLIACRACQLLTSSSRPVRFRLAGYPALGPAVESLAFRINPTAPFRLVRKMEQKRIASCNHCSLRHYHDQEGRILNISRILSELKAERRKLDAAIRALQRVAPSMKQSVRSGRSVRKTERTARKPGSRGMKPGRGKLLMFSGGGLASDKSQKVVSGTTPL